MKSCNYKNKGKESIIKVESVLEDFKDETLHPGKYSFPFVIPTPAWLPSSFYNVQLDSPQRSIKTEVTYFIKTVVSQTLET